MRWPGPHHYHGYLVVTIFHARLIFETKFKDSKVGLIIFLLENLFILCKSEYSTLNIYHGY